MSRTFHVYLLASRSRVLYVGMTNDLARRIAEHRAGLSTHTARYRIDRLVYAEEHPTARDAIAREKQVKAWRREKKVALIEAYNPTWRDLEPSRYSHSSSPSVGRRDPSTPLRSARDDGQEGTPPSDPADA